MCWEGSNHFYFRQLKELDLVDQTRSNGFSVKMSADAFKTAILANNMDIMESVAASFQISRSKASYRSNDAAWINVVCILYWFKMIIRHQQTLSCIA